MVQYLVKDRNLNAQSTDENLCITLQYACRVIFPADTTEEPGMVEEKFNVVQYLIEECHCDPLI